MKWFNKDNTASLNLDLIVFWKYLPGSKTLKVFSGTNEPLILTAEEAEEVYKMLTSNKEIL